MAKRMNTPACELLNEFLNDQLDADGSQHFEAHLASCAACQAAVQQQQWIEDLLRSVGTAALEPVPVEGRRLLSQDLATARRRERVRQAMLGVATAAAALWLSAFLWSRSHDGGKSPPGQATPLAHRAAANDDQRTRPSMPSESVRSDSTATTLVIADAPSVTSDGGRVDSDAAIAQLSSTQPAADFHGNGDVIALEVESPSPDVTVYQVYTTTDAQRRGQIATMLSSASTPSSGDF